VSTLLHEVTLTLEPLPVSAAKARAFVTRVLAETGRNDWAESAQLAVSEIVTNAVLHAHTRVDVTVRVSDDELRIEVRDDNPHLPTQRSYESGATTGRGMELVAAVSAECGVTPVAPVGKVVWFVIRQADSEPSAEDLLATWDFDEAWQTDAGDGVASAPETAEVVLQEFPPTLWLAAAEHHDAVLREFVLYAAEHETGDAAAVPLADDARAWLASAVDTGVERARAAGVSPRRLPAGHPSPLPETPASIEVTLSVPADAQAAFLALQDVLDAAERVAVLNRLLIRPALPEIVAVRDWVCEQVVSQLGGVLPSAWAGADQEHFTVQVRDTVGDRPAQEWDATVVRDAERGVIAADEANRIVAVSRPLAAELGWDVDDLVGRRIVAIVPPAMREAHVAGFSRHLHTGESHVLGVPIQLPVLRADGTQVDCHFLIEQADTDGGRPVYVAWITPV
jgi:PAS domain S-box-containing protein